MKKQILGLFVGLIAFAAACALMPVGEFYAGEAEARLTSTLQGELVFKRCADWKEDDFSEGYEQMLAERFGIRTVAVPCHDKKVLFCMTERVINNVEVATSFAPCSLKAFDGYPPSLPMLSGYNSVLQEEVDEVYGKGAFAKATGEYFERYMREKIED